MVVIVFRIKYRERDVKVWKHFKVYFKWGWNMLPFDINSVVFHFDDFNYGRRSKPYFFLTTTSFKIYLEILSYFYITFTIFYYNTISLKGKQNSVLVKGLYLMCISYCLHDWQTVFIILFSSIWTVDREKNKIF
jgi:hypothetical protein